ncbi:hypothetical protein Barb7_00641 [Bacteroidales bacterium Barb7]|nr:hypothetical protein Barb7_00641 [Bacteroidales bacterium Barb7]
MQNKEYEFVTIDSEEAVWTDAVAIDSDNDGMLSDAVFIDENYDGSNFIMLSDDTLMLSDADMLDMSSADWNAGGMDDIIVMV